jgi:hypothetical protein
MIYQLTKQNKKLFDMWKEQSVSVPKPTKAKTPEPQPQPSSEQPSTTQPKTITKLDDVFQEPEEFTAESMVSDMMGGKEQSNFENTSQAEGMPTFGDPDILKELDKLSKQETPNIIDVTPVEEVQKPQKKKRGRPRKTK